MNYSIGQFSKLTHLSTPTLRYYEQEQLIVVNRDSAGRRYYSAEDVDWILFIKKLKDTGMPIREIREYAILRYQGDATVQQRLEILVNHKLTVVQEKAKLDNYLQNLEEKIKVYQHKLNIREPR